MKAAHACVNRENTVKEMQPVGGLLVMLVVAQVGPARAYACTSDNDSL